MKEVGNSYTPLYIFTRNVCDYAPYGIIEYSRTTFEIEFLKQSNKSEIFIVFVAVLYGYHIGYRIGARPVRAVMLMACTWTCAAHRAGQFAPREGHPTISRIRNIAVCLMSISRIL